MPTHEPDVFEFRLSFRKNRRTGEITVFWPAPSGFDQGKARIYQIADPVASDLDWFSDDPEQFYLSLSGKTVEKVSEVGKKAFAS